MHELEKQDTYVSRVLCFPKPSCAELSDRVSRLVRAGFLSLVEEGKLFQGIRVLGKGYTSVVVLALHAVHGLGALKVRRLDSRRASLATEGELLSYASTLGVAPRVYYYDDDYVFMEYLDSSKCTPFEESLARLVVKGDVEGVRSAVSRVLDALFLLDKHGLFHRELNRPGSHIMVCEGGVKVLDWESASRSGKPSNLTQLVSYLLHRFKYSDQLKRALNIKEDAVLETLRAYKNSVNEENLNNVKRCLGLVQL
ncbi:Ser/Thr protein kinase-like protein [Thermogladius calderae 1633]|uniref:Ser/Thr protein kinase-like protein n=1 Tax=Thermogladius calderae (strain DSM 22663 / VKM B-2946 / 1633) TaxID=1184251 RepID=I3TCL0_THEC1|nr:Ser/Thr protein kinase-like protein [Thermogladius calderae 1633]